MATAEPGDVAPDQPIRFKLEPAHIKQRLIRELAEQKKTQAVLAKEYGVSHPSIVSFKQRHKRRIEAVRADLENEFAGLWIADKSARVAHYEATIEQLDAQIFRALEGLTDRESIVAQLMSGTAVEDIDVAGDISDTLTRLMKEKARALRAVAEELGQLPSRVQVNLGAGTSATLKLEGVDLDKL